MINSSEKCCSPFTCSSLSTVGGAGSCLEKGGRKEGRGKERGEERKGLSAKSHNYIHSAKVSASVMTSMYDYVFLCNE